MAGMLAYFWWTVWWELVDFVDIAISIREIRAAIVLRGHSITKWTKREGEGVSRNSTLGHVTKGRCDVKCPQLSTRGGLGGEMG